MIVLDSLSTPISLLLGDVPPPPPEIPIIHATVPHPIVIVIVGVCISLAAILFGVRWRKIQKASLAKWAFAVGVLVAVSTAGAAAWAGVLYKARSNWSSPGRIYPWPDPPGGAENSPGGADNSLGGADNPLGSEVDIGESAAAEADSSPEISSEVAP